MVIDFKNCERKYDLIYTDPPWNQKKVEKGRADRTKGESLIIAQSLLGK